MNSAFFAGKPSTQALLNSQICEWLTCFASPYPNQALKTIAPANFGVADLIRYTPASDTASAYIVVACVDCYVVLIAGAETSDLVNQLIPGAFGGVPINSQTGAHEVFYLAAEGIIANTAGFSTGNGLQVFIAGHSFGGATAQVLGYLMQSRGLAAGPRVWSYGSPRPGVARFATLVAAVDSSRFMTLTDPVPHLPPTSDDDLSIAAFLSVGHLRLSNSLVQPPYGYLIDTDNKIIHLSSNNNVSLNFLGFTIFNSAFALNFTGSAGHTLAEYRSDFQACIPTYHPPTVAPTPNPERAVAQTTRQRDAVVAQARAVVVADATAPGGITRTYVVPPVQTPSAPSYHARKDGEIWTIQLAGQIVGIATGKRDAKRIARTWNRSARAALRS